MQSVHENLNGNSFRRTLLGGEEVHTQELDYYLKTPLGNKTSLRKAPVSELQSHFISLPLFFQKGNKHNLLEAVINFFAMNFLRSFQAKDHFQSEVVGEQDYFDKRELQVYEESVKKAAEMELILGNALALHQRDTGSIHKMERYGEHSAIEVGKRIGSMHSRADMTASGA